MSETESEFNNGAQNTELPTMNALSPINENTTSELTPESQSERSQEILKTAGLNVMQQLKQSGSHLLHSMNRVGTAEGEEFNAMEVVELAKALATTAQTQANLLKVFKDLTK